MNLEEAFSESKTTMSVKKSDLKLFKENYMQPEEKTFKAFERALVDLKVKPDAHEMWRMWT